MGAFFAAEKSSVSLDRLSFGEVALTLGIQNHLFGVTGFFPVAEISLVSAADKKGIEKTQEKISEDKKERDPEQQRLRPQ